MPSPHIFVSYVREDEVAVSRLASELEAVEFSVWLDRTRLAAGVRWKDEIRRAIGSGAAFLACFSPASEARDRSYMREELALACDELRLRPRERAWFIPVVLASTEIPEIPISSHETIRDLQYVDLSAEWDHGVRRLVEALRPIDVTVDRLLERAADQSPDSAALLTLLDRAVTLSPNRRDARRARAKARIAAGLPEQAVDDYEEAAPGYAAERAWCYWLTDDPDSALALYKRIVKQGSATAIDRYDLGCLLYDGGRLSEALDAFLEACTAAPGAMAPRLAALRILLRQSDHDRTADFAAESEKCLGEHADFLEAQALAMIYGRKRLRPAMMTGDDVRAYDHSYVVRRLARACELDPSNPRRLFRASMLLFQLNDYENSRDAASLGLRLLPDSRSFRAILAQVAEYGPDDVSKDLPTPAQLYTEAANMPPDELDCDDDMPVFDGDERSPRPAVRRYTTVPLTVAGVATP